MLAGTCALICPVAVHGTNVAAIRNGMANRDRMSGRPDYQSECRPRVIGLYATIIGLRPNHVGQWRSWERA
jgi:hypothetical protein